MADIQVVAVLTAKPGSEEVVGQALRALAESTRAEAGCVSYDLFASTADKAAFITIETWQSEEDLQAHLRGPGVQQALSAAGEHLAQPPAIHPLTPVSAG